MKHLIFVLIMLLVLSLLAVAQPGGKQPVPNFVGNPKQDSLNNYGAGWGIGKFTGGVQGVRSAMLHGPHDFTKDSSTTGVRPTDSLGAAITVNRPNAICSYCHSIHIPETGIPVPLWNRASVAGKTFGKYENPISLDATVYDPGTTAAGFKDNYSSFCMSCHDGSAGIFASAAYSSGGFPGDVSKVPDQFAFGGTGEQALSHTHPVNFDYNAVQALVPEELYPAVDPVSAVWKGYSGANGVNTAGSNYTTVRLFNGQMQCSSCHNPHMSSGIGTTLTSDLGRRCVACHKK